MDFNLTVYRFFPLDGWMSDHLLITFWQQLYRKLKSGTVSSSNRDAWFALFIRKGPDAGKDWKQEEKGTTEDEMTEWHLWLNGHEFSKLWERVKDREAWRATAHGVTKSQTWQSNWTTAAVEENHIIFIWKITTILLLKILLI